MTRLDDLFLHERVLLLALRDETGTLTTHWQGVALGGALYGELLLGGRITLVEGRHKPLVDVVDDTPFGEPVLDECLYRVADAKRRAEPGKWLRRFAETRNLHHRVAEGLCDRGVLRADQQSILLIFRRSVYPELDPRPERALLTRLRDAILTDRHDLSAETAAVLGIAHVCGLLGKSFERALLKSRKRQLDQLVKTNEIASVTKAVYDEMNEEMATAAVIAAVC